MKKFKTLFFAFILIGMTLASCSSDDGPGGPAPTIEGKWNQIKKTVKVDNAAPQTFEYNDNAIGCPKNYFEFTLDNVFKDVVYYKQSGICQQGTTTPGAWLKTDNLLTISNAGIYSGTYKITSLTSNGLQIQLTDNNGLSTTITTLYLEKEIN